MTTPEIIYVEDDEQEAFIMQVGMRRQGIQILHVPDVALDSIGDLMAAPYDSAVALIFDAILTGASGVALAQALRDKGDQRPIILLTAGENPDAKLLGSLRVHYMRKPPNYATLAEIIRREQAD